MKKQLRKKVRFAAVAIVAAMLFGGCGGSEKDDPPSTTRPTSTATATTPAWQAKYSKAELKAYENALAAWNNYLDASEPIWAAGKQTAGAKKMFQTYFVPWQVYYAQLGFYEKHGLTRTGRAKVLSSQASRIELSKDSGAVTIRQCLDSAKSLTVTQNGRLVRPATLEPQYQTVELDRYKSRWLIVKLTESSGESPCAA